MFHRELQIHDASAPDSSVSSFTKPQLVFCFGGTQFQQVKYLHHHQTPCLILGLAIHGHKHSYKILERHKDEGNFRVSIGFGVKIRGCLSKSKKSLF